MEIIIATCNDIAEFGQNRLSSRDWSSRFLGTGWITELHARADSLGWTVASGDVVVEKLNAGIWKAADVLVVQELGAKQGKRLLDLGAQPLLLTCMESPIYAPLFYDQLDKWLQVFPYAMVPGGMQQSRDGAVRCERLRFPCYWKDEVRLGEQWSDRKPVMLTAGNKYWSDRPPLPLSSLRRLLSSLRNKLRLSRSETWRHAEDMQLHDNRFRAIAALAQESMIDVYGAGWGDLAHLPEPWRQLLESANLHVFGVAEDKLELQARYKFALAFENASYPGYVTEKIVQCFVSGTIPIYLGAPDIADFVPHGAFIDARALSTVEMLPDCINRFGDVEADHMLQIGRDFLQTPAGQMHSYEGFADWFVSIANRWCDEHRR